MLRTQKVRGEDVSDVEYNIAWENYKKQQKKVKVMLRNGKVTDENRRIKELREREESEKQWYDFLRGEKRTMECTDELIVNGSSVSGKSEITKAIKSFWEDNRGANEIGNEERCSVPNKSKGHVSA